MYNHATSSLTDYFTEQITQLRQQQPRASHMAELVDAPVYNRGIQLTGQLVQLVTRHHTPIVVATHFDDSTMTWTVHAVYSTNPLIAVGGIPTAIPLEEIQRCPQVTIAWDDPATEPTLRIQQQALWVPPQIAD